MHWEPACLPHTDPQVVLKDEQPSGGMSSSTYATRDQSIQFPAPYAFIIWYECSKNIS